MLLPFCLRFAGHFRDRRRVIAIIAALLCHMPAVAAPNETAPRLEYQVKAGYLFNFLRFTEWPAEMQRVGTPLRVGVLEDAAAFNVIADTLRGKTLNERTIEVESLKTGDAFHGFHLVFVPRTAAPPPTNPTTEGVLLVGETKDFALHNGMIGFVLRGYNIRFQVNLTAAHHAGLKLSGRLASLAEIVQAKAP
jgi:hypothetical protein